MESSMIWDRESDLIMAIKILELIATNAIMNCSMLQQITTRICDVRALSKSGFNL